MKRALFVVVMVAFASPVSHLAAQSKSVLIVTPFTAAAGVELPYDLKQVQGQLVAELRTMLNKDFEVVAEPPSNSRAATYTLQGEIKDWRAGNVAKRMIVGMGSGREATDIRYRVTDGSDKRVIEHDDTVRTNFYSQGAGSTGTLAHPIAQKIAERIKDAKLR
jgi:hypothetical protein